MQGKPGFVPVELRRSEKEAPVPPGSESRSSITPIDVPLPVASRWWNYFFG